MTLNTTINLSIEACPDGEVVVFIKDEALVTFSREELIESMVSNARSCDWLSLKDMKQLGHDLIKRAEQG